MVDSISSNIINQLGGGSGIDTAKLVDDLVALQRAPVEQRLDARETKIEANVSGLGILRSVMGELEKSLDLLSDPETFDAKETAVPDTDLMSISKLESDAVPGNYLLNIDQVARSQSLSSGSFASLDSTIGQGTLDISFGDWDGTQSTFTADTEKTGASIQIDESNNTLEGLRDSINEAGIGVNASIVGSEGDYQLLLTSPTGATNELKITATGDASLSAFEFNETTQNLTQQQAGQDAIMRVNGYEVRRDSNTVTDVIEGMEFDIFNADPNEDISIEISEDHSQGEAAIKNFVQAYNYFQSEMSRLTGPEDNDSDDEEQQDDGAGSLRTDSLARSLSQTVRSMIGSSIPGAEEGFSALTNIGIRTKIDGSLEIVEDGTQTDFRAAMDNHYDAVRDLFVGNTESTNTKIQVAGHSSRTEPGEYDVQITQDATRGSLTGDPLAVGFPLDTTGKDYSFTIQVNGKSADITLPGGKTYADGAELAADLQAQINQDQGLQDADLFVNVNFDTATNSLTLTSDTYGRDSKVNITAVGADMGDLGFAAPANGVAGTDVAGTINGEEAVGNGQILRGATGSSAEGLKLEVAAGATQGSITFSRGFGSRLQETMDSYMSGSGLINDRQETLRDNLADIQEDREALDRRMEAFRIRQETQFRAMESIIRQLNNAGGMLDGLKDRMPFTSSS